MNELSQILDAIADSRPSDWALATVVGVSGSTYRLPGAKQLLRADGTSVGTVSGGCLDADLLRIVGEVIQSQAARFVTYDLTADEDEVWGFGLGCNGVTQLLVEPASTAAPLLTALATARAASEAIAVVTVLDGPKIGARLLVRGDQEIAGDLGSPDQNAVAASEARDAIGEGRHRRAVLAPGTTAFVEVQVPAPQLLVCGAGHDAIPLVRYGAELGWRVTVVDDRRSFLTPERFPQAAELVLGRAGNLAELVVIDGRTDTVVMTHNYVRDVEFMRELIRSPARYIGVLGPRSRTDRILAELGSDGVAISGEAFGRIRAPAGLDIGAEGPDQIAWAILAEILAVSRGRAGGSLRDRTGGIHQGSSEGRTA